MHGSCVRRWFVPTVIIPSLVLTSKRIIISEKKKLNYRTFIHAYASCGRDVIKKKKRLILFFFIFSKYESKSFAAQHLDRNSGSMCAALPRVIIIIARRTPKYPWFCRGVEGYFIRYRYGGKKTKSHVRTKNVKWFFDFYQFKPMRVYFYNVILVGNRD